jgi:predicted transcriptional regulator of viral defense system
MEINFSQSKIIVTDVERTLIDCIHRQKYAQGLENIIHAIKHSGKVDSSKLIHYMKQYRLPSLIVKTCYLLDRYGEHLKISEDDLIRLRPYFPQNPVSLVRNEQSNFDSKWKIYVPEYLQTN